MSALGGALNVPVRPGMNPSGADRNASTRGGPSVYVPIDRMKPRPDPVPAAWRRDDPARGLGSDRYRYTQATRAQTVSICKPHPKLCTLQQTLPIDPTQQSYKPGNAGTVPFVSI